MSNNLKTKKLTFWFQLSGNFPKCKFDSYLHRLVLPRKRWKQHQNYGMRMTIIRGFSTGCFIGAFRLHSVTKSLTYPKYNIYRLSITGEITREKHIEMWKKSKTFYAKWITSVSNCIELNFL